jgi:hypothetical protein
MLGNKLCNLLVFDLLENLNETFFCKLRVAHADCVAHFACDGAKRFKGIDRQRL